MSVKITNVFSVEQAAKKLNLSIETVRRYIKNGDLKARKIGKQYRITEDALNSFIQGKEKNIKSEFNSNESLGRKGVLRLHHHKHHENKKIKNGLNSMLSETLLELVDEISSIEEIEKIIYELDSDMMYMYENIKKSGIQIPKDFIYKFVDEEANRALNIRKEIKAAVMKKPVGVFLPLPPHITDAIMSVSSSKYVYNTEDKEPAHTQKYKVKKLKPHMVLEVNENFKDIDTLVMDGQVIAGKLMVRDLVANILNLLFSVGKLKKIYFHKIPHIPKGQNFVAIKLLNNVEIERI